MPGALEGVRVLDCTQIIAGPLAGSLLSEMGADVVKVEPLEGEPWRLQAEIIPKESKAYLSQNRGKRGLALDFKAPGAAPVRDALIRWADVLLTNYRPGVPESLGIDYESARKIRPDIIYAENTAFGKLGPDANRRGYDIVAQAMSGLTTSNPNLQNGLPMQVGFAPADVMSGIALAWGITAALYHREKTGEGQALNTSLLLTALTLQAGSKEILAMDEEPRERRRSAVEPRGRAEPTSRPFTLSDARSCQNSRGTSTTGRTRRRIRTSPLAVSGPGRARGSARPFSSTTRATTQTSTLPA